MQNDLAVALVHLGERETALKYFQAIEKNQPGLYRTAANMGTTYELLGDNPNALRWIRKGLDRNAESHAGSEWIHLRILEAKIAGKTTSVLGLDFGDAARPKNPPSLPKNARGGAQTLAQVEDALIVQLHERLPFTSVPLNDPIVASLLFDLGNCLALRGDHAGAAAVYQKALDFRPKNRTLVQSRLDAALGKMPLATRIALAALMLGAIGAGGTIWRKRHENAALARVQFLEETPEKGAIKTR